MLIKNGIIHDAIHEAPFTADLLLRDGKIAAIGENLPDGGETVLDASGLHIYPGFVDAHSHLGLSGDGIGYEGTDYNEHNDIVTPHLRGIDGFKPMQPSLLAAARAGVTCVCTGPGSANVLGGTFVAVKTVGCRVDHMVVKEAVAMKCAFGENPKGAYGQNGKKTPVTRMGVAALLRELLYKTRDYLNAKEAGKNPAFDLKLEAMIPVLKKEIPLKAHAHQADDIFTAIRIAKEFDLKLTLDHCTDGSRIADELAEDGYPALVGPSFGSKSKVELKNKEFETAAKLHAAGVPIAIITDAPVLPLESLTMCAGLAASAGLPYEEAWRAITISPATYMGIADRVGSLEAGKDADAVIWNADPLTALGSALTYMTIIDGKVVYSAE